MVEVRQWIEFAAVAIEVLATIIMVLFIAIGTVRWLHHSARQIEGAYPRYRLVVGKSILVGLELLVAADIIRTVALDVTPTNLAMLAGLVLVRTFLGWALTVEVEGHWPWQQPEKLAPESRSEPPPAVSLRVGKDSRKA